MARSYARSGDVQRLQAKALAKGGRVRLFAGSHKQDAGALLSRTVEVDYAGNCLKPVRLERHGRAETTRSRVRVVSRGKNEPRFIQMDVPCRKCTNCRKRHAAHWALRTAAEFHSAVRAWIFTLTLSPAAVAFSLHAARIACRRKGIAFEELSADEQFAARDVIVYREFQKRLKLLRKNTEVPFRYLAVTEAHKSGEPHWHVVVFETTEKAFRLERDFRGRERDPVTRKWKRVGSPFWTMGHADYDLVDHVDQCTYVCKYLTKHLRARVRASKCFGAHSGAPMPPLAETTEGGAERR